MGRFFSINWVVILVTCLIIGGGYYLQKSSNFISKTLKVEPKSFYIIMGMLGIILSLVNYIAVVVFGSWQTLIFTAIGAVVVVYGVLFYLKRRSNNTKKD
ncbi:MFS transporter [Erysipelothrix sp. HDW6C]|uniref:MFS transporter n=1 Tax=Erysipelothrix sp. HDW6C TaxID=2714930 RepID=UPI00140B88D3|nr:MFS transporter [Erysipelothrix sp. HDW6C]QIK69133.1 MFS transporter [Erysipelothrix sp. HDW6C]